MLGINNLVIVYCDYGRLGNRLHTHANALAWCIENNYNLINLSFCEYADLFTCSRKHNSGNLHQNKQLLFKILSKRPVINFLRKLLLSDKWLRRLAWLIRQIKPSNSEILLEVDLNSQIKQKKLNLIKHWDIRCSNSLQINQNKIRAYLKPNENFISIAENIINNLRSKYDFMVGIHARRADYATYLGGVHYHPWESYLIWAKETKKLLEEEGKQNIGVIICSDETFPSSIPKEKFIHFSSSEEIMVDVHLLCLCDYNLGPPSSFGTWASWFGQVPRFSLFKSCTIDSIKKFNICPEC